jgi:hypothetical protein
MKRRKIRLQEELVHLGHRNTMYKLGKELGDLEGLKQVGVLQHNEKAT